MSSLLVLGQQFTFRRKRPRRPSPAATEATGYIGIGKFFLNTMPGQSVPGVKANSHVIGLDVQPHRPEPSNKSTQLSNAGTGRGTIRKAKRPEAERIESSEAKDLSTYYLPVEGDS